MLGTMVLPCTCARGRRWLTMLTAAMLMSMLMLVLTLLMLMLLMLLMLMLMLIPLLLMLARRGCGTVAHRPAPQRRRLGGTIV